MKKVLIGCGIVFVLLFIAVVGAGFFVIRAVKGVVAEGKQLNDQYTATNADFPFKAPADDAVTLDQLDRWLGARKKLTPALKDFVSQMKGQKGPLAVYNTLKDKAPAIVDAHVRALRDQKMSFEEYFWVAKRVFTALQSGDALQDPDLKEIVAANGKVEEGQRGQRNGQANQMHIPMTSDAIKATLASIRERKQDMLDTVDATVAEVMIGPMVDGFSRGRFGGPAPASTSQSPSSDAATTSTQSK